MIRSIIVAAALLVGTPVLARDAQPAVAAQQNSLPREGRFILLDGGRNFRDVGGYWTEQGQMVKPGLLYRSGSLGSLTAEGQAELAKLHVASIIDLRTTDERSHDTNDLMGTFGSGYFSRDYGMSMGDMRSIFSDPSKLTADGMRSMMTMAYRTMAKEQTPAYRELFARLLAGKGPVVVNCTAGKDRTGIGTALVLTALGVPYDTVRGDFLLSNGAPGMETLGSSLPPALGKLPPEVAAPLVGVDGEYLDTAFAQLRKDYGSIDAYMQTELGVGPKEKAALRQRMLY